jgi:FixJ family two-component response regulator
MNSLDATVFVVEDDSATRGSFEALGNSLGLHVEAFAAAEEFLAVLDVSRPGCVVADFRLQGVDGIELHRRLIRAGCRLPVIVISAYLDVRTAAAAIEQGIFRIVEKPYQNDDLAQAVLDALHHDRTQRQRNNYRLDFAHRLDSLDARERLTLDLIVSGSGAKTVERKLGVSTRTVERIKSAILAKMNFLSFVELSAAYGAAQTTGFRVSNAAGHDVGGSGLPATSAPGLPSASRVQDNVAQRLEAGLQHIQTLLARSDATAEQRRLLGQAESALTQALTEAYVPNASPAARPTAV